MRKVNNCLTVQDLCSNEVEEMSLEGAKEKYIFLLNDDEDYQPTEIENKHDLNEISMMDSRILSEKLEGYGYCIL